MGYGDVLWLNKNPGLGVQQGGPQPTQGIQAPSTQPIQAPTTFEPANPSPINPTETQSSTPVYYGAPVRVAAVPPNPWNTTITYTAPTGVKQADPDIITFDDEIVSGTFLVERFFEEIGAVELINISRSDIINGDLVNYTPIKNLSALRRQYNPNNIIAIASTAQSAFSRFRIDLLLRGINEPYLDDEGNLVIEVDIVDDDEFIEAEIATSGTMNRIEL